MSTDAVAQAAQAFGLHGPCHVDELSSGLIHQTFRVRAGAKTIILQQINTSVFRQPEQVVANHVTLFQHLQQKSVMIAEPLPTITGDWTWSVGEQVWRAQQFIENTYTETGPLTEERAFQTAHCFASFTQALSDLNPVRLHEPLPHFHDLRLRFAQLEASLKTATQERIHAAHKLIAQAYAWQSLVTLVESLRNQPQRIQHHDAKLSNVLFDQITHLVVCPIDLDTTMPGYFYSDIGDMIRSMAITASEASTAWDAIDVHPQHYAALIDGYRTGMDGALTADEQSRIHVAGKIMLYMQGIRFLADYLNGDVYYKTHYAEQNFDRCKNQFIALDKLDRFLKLSGSD